MKITLRMATPADAGALLAIYRPYVEQTAVSFETETPTLTEFCDRMQSVLKKFPYIVAESEGELCGYAYAAPFKERAAYAWSVETTIYVKQEFSGRGCGSLLYGALEEILRKQNIQNLNACIAATEKEDKHLDNGSAVFHQKMGFKLVGKFHKSGFKFGKWYDMIWMEKHIGAHPPIPPAVLPVTELADTDIFISKR